MIKFEVSGETWKEILEKLDGMFPVNDTNIKSMINTIEEPEDSFKTEVLKEPESSTTTVEPEVIKKPVGRPPKVEGIFPNVYKLPFGPLDSANQPWDKNIHARTKSKTADGRWREKRTTPGFASKEDSKRLSVSSDPVIAAATPPTIPDLTQPPTMPPANTQSSASVVDTQQKMIAYLTKIKESGNTTYDMISAYFTKEGIVDILHIPTEKYPEVAEKLKTQFGVDY